MGWLGGDDFSGRNKLNERQNYVDTDDGGNRGGVGNADDGGSFADY